MPRRLKEGLDYFPVDVKIFNDPKIVRLMYDHGPDAVMIYFMLLAKVYDNGYFLECDLERMAYLISYDIRFKESNKDLDYVYRILRDFVKLDIIDSLSLDSGIITSKGIQKQFLASTQRRKQRERPHWILSPEDAEALKKYIDGINFNRGYAPKVVGGIVVNPGDGEQFYSYNEYEYVDYDADHSNWHNFNELIRDVETQMQIKEYEATHKN